MFLRTLFKQNMILKLEIDENKSVLTIVKAFFLCLIVCFIIKRVKGFYGAFKRFDRVRMIFTLMIFPFAACKCRVQRIHLSPTSIL